jgi:tRNA dimethylallyltransferase
MRATQQQRYRPLLVALERDRDALYARINLRVDTMFASGLVEEVRRLLASGVPLDAHALKAIGYRQVVAIERGKADLQTAVADTKRASRRLAKRQLTWLRNLREGRLHWVAPGSDFGVEEVLALWDGHGKGSGER